MEVMIIQIYSLIEKNEQFTLFGHDSPIYYLLLLNIEKLISLEVKSIKNLEFKTKKFWFYTFTS